MAKFPIVWEEIERLSIERLQVPGGWLVKPDRGDTPHIVFVPDAKHEWDLESPMPREGKRREG